MSARRLVQAVDGDRSAVRSVSKSRTSDSRNLRCPPGVRMDPMRPAEALVIFGFYPDPATARRALDGIGSTVVEAYIGSKLERQEALALRLGKMLGIRSARKLAGRLIPGVAIAFTASCSATEVWP